MASRDLGEALFDLELSSILSQLAVNRVNSLRDVWDQPRSCPLCWCLRRYCCPPSATESIDALSNFKSRSSHAARFAWNCGPPRFTSEEMTGYEFVEPMETVLLRDSWNIVYITVCLPLQRHSAGMALGRTVFWAGFTKVGTDTARTGHPHGRHGESCRPSQAQQRFVVSGQVDSR